MNEFQLNPTSISKPRSVFPIGFRAPTTLKVGEITPLMVKEVLPGDTFSIDLSSVIVAYSPFVSRVYGDLFLDVYAFFVPNRLVWNHWEQFCGQNDEGAWTQTNSYEIPNSLYQPVIGDVGCIGDHMNLPMPSSSDDNVTFSVSELPLRGYERIYNEWFRNQNTTSPVAVVYGDDGDAGDLFYESQPLKASRFADYFSQCLPGPQKGPDVTFSLGESAPIIGDTSMHSLVNGISLDRATGAAYSGTQIGILNNDSNHLTGGLASTNNLKFASTNLVADLSAATATSIENFRLLVMTERYLETLATGGSRYIETLKSLFGVTNGDARLQRTELLGGKKIPLRFQEVVATSSSTDTSATQYALGQQVVKSSTNDVSSLFTKSFTEHGWLHVYGVIRAKHQYSQGIDRSWRRKDFLDFYNPLFDHLGETPVYEDEIYATESQISSDSPIFGYQEAWADYRYDRDCVTGYLRPNLTNGLSTFTFAENFTDAPTLSGFMNETRSNVKRTMTLTDESLPDFICDFYFFGKKARAMSRRSRPAGLVA